MSLPSDAQLHDWLAAYDAQGYVILEGVLDSSEVETLRDALRPYLGAVPPGRNVFEGESSKRVYSLVGRGRPFERTAEHRTVLALVDRLLDPGYLLTASQAICLQPGETPQPVHFDDSFYPLPRPRKAISVSTIWAVDDFTAQNGGTEVIPGSHRWSDAQVADTYRGDPNLPDDPALEAAFVPVEMLAGSCAVFAGTLLHRGGANRSPGTRSAFSHQYCEPWARQQENYLLSVPAERAPAFNSCSATRSTARSWARSPGVTRRRPWPRATGTPSRQTTPSSRLGA
ncbi:MAG: phytanoyl-CoA dioxygenase family protein [Deltaproteobacteria bacterium]|nr:phytanoyl-CoA dioxygenase family protein [Deltaproteobacteria bacterium]